MFYIGSKLGWDAEIITLAAGALGVLMTIAVHYLHSNFPVLLNALETATGRDLDNDGDIGKQ